MPTCCRPTCASCAAWSTARTCRSTSRARCCRTIRRSAQIRKALTGRVISELESLAEQGRRELRQDLGRVRPRCSRKASTRTTSGATSCSRWRASTPPPATGALAQAIRRRPQAEPDRDLLSRRRQRRAPEIQPEARSGARARHRGAAADRSGRCVLDRRCRSDFEGKPLKSLSQGEVDFGLVPLLDDKAEAEGRARRRDRRCGDHRGGEGRARRTRLRRARLAAPDRQRRLPGGRRPGPRPRARAAAGAPEPRRRRQADPRAQHAPCAGEGGRRDAKRAHARRRGRPLRRCCSTRRRSSTARCRTIRRPSRDGSTPSSCAGWARVRTIFGPRASRPPHDHERAGRPRSEL